MHFGSVEYEPGESSRITELADTAERNGSHWRAHSDGFIQFRFSSVPFLLASVLNVIGGSFTWCCWKARLKKSLRPGFPENQMLTEMVWGGFLQSSWDAGELSTDCLRKTQTTRCRCQPKWTTSLTHACNHYSSSCLFVTDFIYFWFFLLRETLNPYLFLADWNAGLFTSDISV